MTGLPRFLASALLGPLLALVLLLGSAGVLWSAPVQWRELPASDAGQQWWDAGSLRRDSNGRLSVLSRFLPAAKADQTRPPLADLYVMQLDCDQGLYRDTSVNGLPRWQAEWRFASEEPLTAAVLAAACEAAAALQPLS
ncbi:MAG: hypothetical protein ACKN89_16845 [Cyanobium sp.]|jgi:hypothetical protein|nr:hypothetical protein [Synechococcaceae cyanobacterium]